jgi:hypothetical protein
MKNRFKLAWLILTGQLAVTWKSGRTQSLNAEADQIARERQRALVAWCEKRIAQLQARK